MGIAYADLPSIEEAERVMHDLDKALFKDRKLRIRFHVPFTPGPRFPRLGSIKRKGKKNVTSVYPPASADGDIDEIITSAGNTPRPTEPLAPSSHLQFSNTVLFVKGMRHKVREEKIMLYFKEFNPMEVIIQKPRGIIKGLKPRACHALVLFDLPLGVTLDKVIADCKTRVFEGGHLTLVRAFALREKLFSLQAPVEGAELRIDGVVLAHDIPTKGSSLATPNANTGCWYSDDEEIEPVRETEKERSPVTPAGSIKEISQLATPVHTKVAESAAPADSQSPKLEANSDLELPSVNVNVAVEEVTVTNLEIPDTQEEATVGHCLVDEQKSEGGTVTNAGDEQEVAPQEDAKASNTNAVQQPLKNTAKAAKKSPESPGVVVGEISLTETAVESEQHPQITEKTAEAGAGVKPRAVTTVE